MQGPSGLLNVVTIPPGATITSPRLVLDGVRGAIFVYTSGGPLGALIGSWAGTAGTDPYGNSYPAGLDVASGSITGTVFTGTDFIMNSQGLFFYSGTPANGNLIISIAPFAGTDSFGNTYDAGIEISGATSFTSRSGNFTASLSGGGQKFFFILASLLELNASGAFLYTGPGGSGNLIASLGSSSGTDPYGNTFPKGLFSQQLTLQDQGAAPPSFSGASVFYSSVAGRPRYKSSAGADNVLQRADVNVATFTVGNVAVDTPISAPITYQANEGNQGSEYEIEIDGIITTAAAGAANTAIFTLSVDNGVTLGGSVIIGAVYLVVASTFNFTLRSRLTIVTSGLSGLANMVSEGSSQKVGANAGSGATPPSDISMSSVGTGKAFDTTILHTIQIVARWGATNAGQQIQSFRSRVTRRF